MNEPAKARRRRRGGPPADNSPTSAREARTPDHGGDPVASGPSSSRRQAGRAAPGRDNGLRDLVGAGKSQLGLSRALRARDVNRPSEQELAEAEQDIEVVRRNWQPDR